MEKIGLIIIALFLIFCSPAASQDWPQWRGPNRDGKASGFKMPGTWPESLTRTWQVKVGLGDASPALVNNRLYVFTENSSMEVTRCLDANTGQIIWENEFRPSPVPGIYNDPLRFQHPGPRSSPAVASGKVITLGVGGVLSCLDAATGQVSWRTEAYTKKVPMFFTAMSPIIVDGMCIAHLGGAEDGSILAFDLQSGGIIWEWTGDGPAYASPVLMTVEGTRQLVVQTEKRLLGITVGKGRLIWEVPTTTKSHSSYNAATPLIDGQKIIYTGQGWGTKAIRIEKDGDLFQVTELWANEDLGTQFNTPVLKDDLIFGLSKRRQFFCLDANDGRTLWVDEARNDSYGSIIDVGEVMCSLPGHAYLIFFKPAGTQYQELARFRISDSHVYTHPVFAGKRIYVKDKETLAMWTIE